MTLIVSIESWQGPQREHGSIVARRIPPTHRRTNRFFLPLFPARFVFTRGESRPSPEKLDSMPDTSSQAKTHPPPSLRRAGWPPKPAFHSPLLVPVFVIGTTTPWRKMNGCLGTLLLSFRIRSALPVLFSCLDCPLGLCNILFDVMAIACIFLLFFKELYRSTGILSPPKRAGPPFSRIFLYCFPGLHLTKLPLPEFEPPLFPPFGGC